MRMKFVGIESEDIECKWMDPLFGKVMIPTLNTNWVAVCAKNKSNMRK